MHEGVFALKLFIPIWVADEQIIKQSGTKIFSDSKGISNGITNRPFCLEPSERIISFFSITYHDPQRSYVNLIKK